MNRLAFDTATAACSVALLRADGRRFENTPDPARMFEQPAHTTELLPAIDQLLREADVAWDELDAVAVGVGPGAFTGLRIGVSTARAIATARQIPLTQVSSLATLTAGAAARTPGRTILPVIDARRKEFFFATDTDAVGPVEELLEAARDLDAPLAVGDGAIKLAETLAGIGVEVPPADDPRHVVSADAMLDLAAQLAPTAVDLVVPNYIRPPDAKFSARESWLAGAPKA
jgi:tRNA threonylcarbamoyladenosine biosynthesis protein TsaB